METKIKSIVATFLNSSPESVNESTSIDRESLRSSIMVHRLFAALQTEGITVTDYTDIKTVGQLINAIDSNRPADVSKQGQLIHSPTSGIGIDLEKLDNFPEVSDYREDEFYKLNFSPREIAYCILKNNPVESFAGLFATKEALVKADSSLRSVPFSSLEIDHDEAGKPVFGNFMVSISHVDRYAIAVVLKKEQLEVEQTELTKPIPQAKLSFSLKLLIYLSFLISIASLFLALFK